jgi:hypothetical protein
MPKGAAKEATSSMSKSKSKPQRYEIHDNGGRPFLVDDYGDHVIVYKQEYNFDTGEYDAPVKLFKKSYKRIFIGDKPAWQRPGNWRPEFKGNSILIENKPNTYVYIGSEIHEWKPVKGDTIQEFWSEMGNSGVPYPFAVGKTHVYFLIGGNDTVSMPIEFFDLKKDMYNQLWLDMSINNCKHQPTARGSDLCKAWKKGDPDLKAKLDFLITNKKPLVHKMIQKRLI